MKITKLKESKWEKHIKISPKKDFNKNIECEICGEKFKITLEDNVEKEELLMFVDRKTKSKNRFIDSLLSYKNFYEQATKYSSKCPSCNYEKELFCVPHNPSIIHTEEGRFSY